MCDTLIVLSSDDETETKKTSEKDSVAQNERKRSSQSLGESSKKRKIEFVKDKTERKDAKESNGITEVGDTGESFSQVVFDEFVGTCLKLDSSVSMQKIIDKKLKKYYSLLVPQYRSSEQLSTFLERKRAEMERSPSQRFMHLKEVVDELCAHRSDRMHSSSETEVSDRFVRKLVKAMELLHRKIKKLEEREVDWDADNDSSYMQLQRYRERLIKVHNKLQEIEGDSTPLFRRKISFSGTQFPSVNKAIEKYVNTKGEFPDYHDIYDLLKSSYAAEGITVTTEKLKVEAKTAFQVVGEQMQKQRQYEYWDAHSTFLEDQKDPADHDKDLSDMLDENKKKFGARIDEIINTFAEKPTIKSQFASGEESNSSEGAIKEEKTDEERNEDEGEDVEEEDDEDGEDENGDGAETMDDILDDINDGASVDDTDVTENLFSYCGPVSPPTPAGGSSNAESLSPLPSPGFELNTSAQMEEAKGEDLESEITVSSDLHTTEKGNGSKLVHDEKNNKSEESNKDTCTSDKVKKGIRTDFKQESESDKCPSFIKVKPLSSLQTKSSAGNEPEEILLD